MNRRRRSDHYVRDITGRAVFARRMDYFDIHYNGGAHVVGPWGFDWAYDGSGDELDNVTCTP